MRTVESEQLMELAPRLETSSWWRPVINIFVPVQIAIAINVLSNGAAAVAANALTFG